MKNFIIFFLLILIFSCKSKEEEKDEGYVVPAASAREENPELAQSIEQGAELYNNFCASCHLSSGEGIQGVFPPLNRSDWLTEKRLKAIHAVKFGLSGPIEVNGEEYNNLMADLGLTDKEITDVMNYVFQAWDNNVEPPVTVEEVKAVEE